MKPGRSSQVWFREFVARLDPNDCLKAIDSLIGKSLLVELTEAEIESDLARWRAEPNPVSWGVDRDRRVGDVDLTELGFRAEATIARLTGPVYTPRPAQGYNDEAAGVIRVFGETEEACLHAVRHLINRIDDTPWQWSKDSIQVGAIRPIGAWWVSRFERVPAGFEVVVRRTDVG